MLRKVRSRNQYGSVESYQVSCQSRVCEARRSKFLPTYGRHGMGRLERRTVEASRLAGDSFSDSGKCQVRTNETLADSPGDNLNLRDSEPTSSGRNC